MELKAKIIKPICFSFFCFLLSVLSLYLLKRLFLWQEGRVIFDLLYTFISFCIFFTFLMICLALVDNRKVVLVFSFFTTFSFLIFFLRKQGLWVSVPAIISYVVVACILFSGINLTNKNLAYERKNSIVFHPVKAILKAGPVILIIFAILFSTLFCFNSPLLDSYGNIQIKEEYIKKIGNTFGKVAVKFFPLPIYDMEMSVDEFIVINSIIGLPFIKGEDDEEEIKPLINIEKSSEAIINYLKDKGIYDLKEVNMMEYMSDDEFRELFVDEVKRLAPTANPYLINKYRKNLSKNWWIEISSQETMGEVYTRLLNNKINEIPINTRNLILIIPAFILFGILEITFLILNMIFALFAWVLMIILYKAKFYHYRKVQVEKEEIEL